MRQYQLKIANAVLEHSPAPLIEAPAIAAPGVDTSRYVGIQHHQVDSGDFLTEQATREG